MTIVDKFVFLIIEQHKLVELYKDSLVLNVKDNELKYRLARNELKLWWLSIRISFICLFYKLKK